MNDIRDIMPDLNRPVWNMLAAGGIGLDRVSVAPAGVWTLASDDDTYVAFGPATTETGETAEGWDWTRYARNDDGEVIEAQDWAPDDAALLDVLRGI